MAIVPSHRSAIDDVRPGQPLERHGPRLYRASEMRQRVFGKFSAIRRMDAGLLPRSVLLRQVAQTFLSVLERPRNVESSRGCSAAELVKNSFRGAKGDHPDARSGSNFFKFFGKCEAQWSKGCRQVIFARDLSSKGRGKGRGTFYFME